MGRNLTVQSNRGRWLVSTAILLVSISAIQVQADEIKDAIQEAVEAYDNKDLATAIESLDYAAQLMRQQKGGLLESYLPEPLDGWTAEEATSQAAGAAMFGGAVTAERVYRKDNKRVTVTLITDSPMVQSMMMMLKNPMFATAGGGKMKRIGGEKAIIKYDANNQSGEVQLAVGNVLVTVNGAAQEDDLVAYTEGVNLKGLAQ